MDQEPHIIMSIQNIILPEKYRVLCKEKVTEYIKDLKIVYHGRYYASELKSILQEHELMMNNTENISLIGYKSFRQFVEGTDLFQCLEKQSKHYNMYFATFMKHTLRYSMGHLRIGSKRQHFFHSTKSNTVFYYFALIAASFARFHHLSLWRGGYWCNLCKELLPFYLKSHDHSNEMAQINKTLNYQADKENFIRAEVEKLLISTHRTMIDAKLKVWFKTVKGIISLKRLTMHLANDQTDIIRWLRQYSTCDEIHSQEKLLKSLQHLKIHLFDDAKDEKILLYILQLERKSKIRKKNLKSKGRKMFRRKAYIILRSSIPTSNNMTIDDMAKRIFKLSSRLKSMQETINLLHNHCPCKVRKDENNTDDELTTQCINDVSQMHKYFEFMLSDLGIAIFSK